MKARSVEPTYVRFGNVVFTIATALIHLTLNFAMGAFDIMFTLNGIGYLALLAALFLDLPLARDNRQLVRYAMIAFALISIIAWIFIGDKTWWVGWVTKAIEVSLIVLLFMKRS